MVNLAGLTARDGQLWHTYLFWARAAIDPQTSSNTQLEIAQAKNRLNERQGMALQAIVFSAFALEFRMRRLLEDLGAPIRRRDTLGRLLDVFRLRLEAVNQMGSTQRIQLPPEWHRLERRLKRLSNLRNRIAHANYCEVKQLLRQRPREVAASSFNAVVDFIRITNAAVGYDKDPPARRRARIVALRVK